MGRLGLAFSTFFKVLGNRDFAEAVREIDPAAKRLPAPAPTTTKPTPAPVATAKPPAPVKPKRSDAVTLLAALQREARLVDFLMEEVSSYSDAQIGAAVRDVHRGGRDVLNRMFAVVPLRNESEGTAIDVPAGTDPQTVSLVGKVTGQPPYRGRLVHGGWQASKLDLPEWTGSDASARVIAPAEIELG
ncbi:MAG TPA: DUF2760 domain-containing protein [Planctomycetaceae bacterium]|nr:DUF2760 domain-containing protein [Planctomycetaceae bacterium]HRF00236.1 DUF2760 domain-containing protein [Pirellulaceae bacterium]